MKSYFMIYFKRKKYGVPIMHILNIRDILWSYLILYSNLLDCTVAFIHILHFRDIFWSYLISYYNQLHCTLAIINTLYVWDNAWLYFILYLTGYSHHAYYRLLVNKSRFLELNYSQFNCSYHAYILYYQIGFSIDLSLNMMNFNYPGYGLRPASWSGSCCRPIHSFLPRNHVHFIILSILWNQT